MKNFDQIAANLNMRGYVNRMAWNKERTAFSGLLRHTFDRKGRERERERERERKREWKRGNKSTNTYNFAPT